MLFKEIKNIMCRPSIINILNSEVDENFNLVTYFSKYPTKITKIDQSKSASTRKGSNIIF